MDVDQPDLRRCIYCLQGFPLGSLTDEHIIQKALGGGLMLKKAACQRCNSDRVSELDVFLAATFPATALARTDLDLRSYSNAPPRTTVVGLDATLGEFEVTLLPGGKAEARKAVRRDGSTLTIIAPDEGSAAEYLRKLTKGKMTLSQDAERGFVSSETYRFKESLDWDTAHRAVAKIFYGYILLEFGEDALEAPSVVQLRRYVLRDGNEAVFKNATNVSNTVPVDQTGSFEIPRHHHALMVDSMVPTNNWVVLFGLFQFGYPFDFSTFQPTGRMLGVDPKTGTIVESLTRDRRGNWRFRVSLDLGWKRVPGANPKFNRREPS